MCTWVVQEQPPCARGQKINFPCTHTNVSNITHVHPPISGKIKRQDLTPHDFVILQDVCSLEREGA
jgi:hypothetical protein